VGKFRRQRRVAATEVCWSFLAPTKTPTTVLATLHDALADLGKDSELRTTMQVHGVKPRGIGIGEFDLYIRTDAERVTPLVATIARPN
jgi:tripartite-type tricarboxylate transporter receptor subunit TctC